MLGGGTAVLSRQAEAFKIEIAREAKDEKSETDLSPINGEKVRENTKVFLKKWLKDAPALPSEVAISSQTISIADHPVKLRIYRPECLGDGLSPALLYHTAGGLVNDMQEEQDLPCALMSQACRCVVISIQPPLAPEMKHPKIVKIANLTTEYLYENAEGYGIDQNAIGISGYSMGGNLALLTTLHAQKEKLPVKALAIISGQVDVSLQARDSLEYNHGAESDFLAPRSMQVMFADFALPAGVDRREAEFSPLYANLSELPPTLLIGGSCDALMADMRAMKAACDRNDVSATLIEIPGAVHNAFFMWHKLGNEGPHMATVIGEAMQEMLYMSKL